MDAALLADPATTALSGRFLFALDDGRGDTAALDADVTMLATPGGDLALTLPGVPGSLRLPSDQAPAAAHAAALLFLAAARASGTRAWRVAELPPGQALSTATLAELAARVPGTRTAPAPETPAPYGGPRPGPTPPRDGRSALHALAPLGRLTAYQWRELAELAARHGAGTLRATPWRGVVVPGLSPARAAEAAAGLARAGLVTVKGSSWEGVGACTGRPGCVKSLADVRADARAALDAAPGAFLSTGPVASAAAATPGYGLGGRRGDRHRLRPGPPPGRPVGGAPARRTGRTGAPAARGARGRPPDPIDPRPTRHGAVRKEREQSV
ncbi:precorrin-3B synthase [Streptomyces albus]|nr:precorrin-3B synthase [Streptomyces albus]